MKKRNNENNQMIVGLLLGGVIGASAACLLRTRYGERQQAMQKFGKTIAEVGEMVSNCGVEKKASNFGLQAEKNLPGKGDMFSKLPDWIDSVLYLWKIIKEE